jgi:CubicO group peptidase (beta-lactamase class C family)
MKFALTGNVIPDRLYCSGSFTKLLTTYITLTLLSEKYDLTQIIDDAGFFDRLCTTPDARNFLKLFQKIIGSQFSLHDICSFYSGLPYTFEVSAAELARAAAGHPFKHHSIPDEKTFLERCANNIVPIFPAQSKFHYSEISILFLGYLVEKVYDIPFEKLYQDYVINKFQLVHSLFSRTRPPGVHCEDLSARYDYPSIAILDHGFFCYSNGFFTTLSDMQILLENLLEQPVFHFMTDIKHARAASNRIMDGLTVELRQVQDDLLFGYEGLSYSGCNIWAYSTKQQRGIITFTNDEEAAYDIYHELGYSNFDTVPAHTQKLYQHFLKNTPEDTEEKDFPAEFQGQYVRVNINEEELKTRFRISNNSVSIRNPDLINYPIIFANGYYRVKSHDKHHAQTIGLLKSANGRHYFSFDGTLYQKI